MAFRRISIAPQSRPDSRYETTYQASRGGWFKTQPKPVPGTPKTKKGDR
ncbi:hypothetical protein [Streptomyces chattanoogensis]